MESVKLKKHIQFDGIIISFIISENLFDYFFDSIIYENNTIYRGYLMNQNTHHKDPSIIAVILISLGILVFSFIVGLGVVYLVK